MENINNHLKDLLLLKKIYHDLHIDDLKTTKYQKFYTNEEFQEQQGSVFMRTGHDSKIGKFIKENKIPFDEVLNMELELGIINKERYKDYMEKQIIYL